MAIGQNVPLDSSTEAEAVRVSLLKDPKKEKLKIKGRNKVTFCEFALLH